jgi:hypothetical protein
MKNVIATILVLTVIIITSGCKAVRGDVDDVVKLKSRTIVALVDLTSSLTEQEFRSVASQARQILSQAPPRSQLYVLAITRDVMGTTALLDVSVPGIDSDAAKTELARWREETADRLIDKLQQKRGSDALTDSKYASCIYEGLRRAGGIIKDNHSDSSDVFVISDMVEECQTSALGHVVKMNKPAIDTELAEVEKVKDLSCDLHGARVLMVTPTRGEYEKDVIRPKSEDLEKYWTHVIAYCKADQSAFHFSPDMPHELFKEAPASPATSTPPVTASAAVAARR